MYEVSKYLKTILNVPAITTIATDGVHALLASQTLKTFVVYVVTIDDTETKDHRTNYTATISAYHNSYDEACKLFDVINTELANSNFKLLTATPSYVVENQRCNVTANYSFKQ